MLLSGLRSLCLASVVRYPYWTRLNSQSIGDLFVCFSITNSARIPPCHEKAIDVSLKDTKSTTRNIMHNVILTPLIEVRYFWGEPHSPHCQKTRFFSFWNQILSFFLVLSPKVHWYYLNRALQSIFRGFFQSVCKKSTDAWFRGRSLRQCQNDLFPTAPKMNL